MRSLGVEDEPLAAGHVGATRRLDRSVILPSRFAGSPPLGKLVRRLILAVVGVLAVAPIAGCSDDSPLPMGQGTSEANGVNLSYWCVGSGSPTVMIEQGLADQYLPEFDPDDWYGWAIPLHDISQLTHVCVYNRRGWPGSNPVESVVTRTSQDHVDDLRSLIDALGLGPPLVMVGHSFGGLDLQLFTSQHPDLVAGLVLVDSNHWRGSEYFDSRGVAGVVFRPEWVDILESEDLVRTVSDLGDIPLVVISQGQFVGASESEAQAWAELQADLATLSTNSEHIVLADSGHLVMIDRPDAIVDAVSTILQQID